MCHAERMAAFGANMAQDFSSTRTGCSTVNPLRFQDSRRSYGEAHAALPGSFIADRQGPPGRGGRGGQFPAGALRQNVAVPAAGLESAPNAPHSILGDRAGSGKGSGKVEQQGQLVAGLVGWD
ncbi:hypothetical protein WJX74_010758 [Apatococcus lobatus]|uniref:Uncharacterized protein n=1 Tax=Apatococcus lobatus TaxID=904363 RepID=A0AAW1Q9F0_9CHLO